ncbi:MAG: AAA family ATPase [Oscillospiraceae bacterium]|nr:AAA family ATPase [Oscillospiraceae bacterium]
MTSIFQNVSTRMYSISGELSDCFCLPNGWILGFEELLTLRMEQLGFDSVVFCSTQREMFYALNMAGAAALETLRGEKKPEPEPSAPAQDTMGYDWLLEDDAPPPAAPPKEEKPLRMSVQVRADQLSVCTDRFMRDTARAKVLVFTSLEDLGKLSGLSVGRRLMECFEEWKGLPNENRNICIFLSRTLDSAGLQAMLHENRAAVLESLFLTGDTFNPHASLTVGAPMQDEIVSLLEILRIKGHTFRQTEGLRTVRLRFCREELQGLARMLSFQSREAGLMQLKQLKELLERQMRESADPIFLFDPDVIRQCFPGSRTPADEDPLELLRTRQGWESAYHILHSFVSNHRALYGGQTEQTAAVPGVCRFEGAQGAEHRGKVPNFVLQGPPGVGKTEIAGLIGRLLQREGVLRSGHTVIGSRDKLVGAYVGSTAIRTAALIEEAQEGVLLVDEVYSIAEKRENGISYCDEVFNTIVAAMTNPRYRFCVIFAGYADRMHEVWEMNEGLYSRFGASNIITLHEYEPPLLQKIFESRFGFPEGASGQVTVLSDEVRAGLPVFFENFYADRDRKHFGNARDDNNLAADVRRAAGYRHLLALQALPVEPSEEMRRTVTVRREDFEARADLFEKRGFSADDIYRKLNAYEGMEFLAEMFSDQLALRVECDEKGIPYPGPSHMIWAGNPGTGKSTAAQLTAELYHSLGILGSTVPIYVDASELMSSYAAGSAENIRKKMDEACQKNAVLVIEEAYQLLERGGSDAIHAMLNRMETDRRNFNLILILYKDKVEEFLSRNPGLASRLKIYEFPDYTAEQLVSIFLRMCEASKDSIDDAGLEKVRSLIDALYRSGRTAQGNARIVRQLLDTMKQRRYRRILGEMALSLCGEDTPAARSRAAAARAMHTAPVPAESYVFTAADVPDSMEEV